MQSWFWKNGLRVHVWVLMLRMGAENRFLSCLKMDRREFLILIGCESLLKRGMWESFVPVSNEVGPRRSGFLDRFCCSHTPASWIINNVSATCDQMFCGDVPEGNVLKLKTLPMSIKCDWKIENSLHEFTGSSDTGWCDQHNGSAKSSDPFTSATGSGCSGSRVDRRSITEKCLVWPLHRYADQ